MARLEHEKLSLSEKRRRRFSDNFKLKKVREKELRSTKISEICRQYDVSYVSVYKWLEKFGMNKNKKERLIVETESDTRELLELKKKVAELERIIGQKQVLLDFQDKLMDIAKETYGFDIKKKSFTGPSNISGTTEKNTPSA